MILTLLFSVHAAFAVGIHHRRSVIADCRARGGQAVEVVQTIGTSKIYLDRAPVALLKQKGAYSLQGDGVQLEIRPSGNPWENLGVLTTQLEGAARRTEVTCKIDLAALDDAARLSQVAQAVKQLD